MSAGIDDRTLNDVDLLHGVQHGRGAAHENLARARDGTGRRHVLLNHLLGHKALSAGPVLGSVVEDVLPLAAKA